MTSRHVRERGDESDSRSLGYGAELAFGRRRRAACDGPTGAFGFLCGKNPFSSSSSSSSSSSEDDPVLFKSRATHVWYDEGGINPYLRTLVHGKSLAAERGPFSRRMTAMAHWSKINARCCRGAKKRRTFLLHRPLLQRLRQQRRGSFRRRGVRVDLHRLLRRAHRDTDTSTPTTESSRAALERHGWRQPADPRWPQFPTRSFSTAGVTRVALSKNWIAIACVDGYAHLWHRGEASAPAAVATLSATGALRPAAGWRSAPGPKNKQVVEALAVKGPFLVVAFAHGQRVARESTVALFRLEDAAGETAAPQRKVTMCGHLPLKDALQDREGKIKVNSVGMNLGPWKGVLACLSSPRKKKARPGDLC